MAIRRKQHVEIYRTSDADEARELALVLASRRIPFVEVLAGPDLVLAVPQAHAERALDEIARYEEENRDWPPVPEELVTLASGKLTALCYGAVLGICYYLDAGRAFALPWGEAGRADAGRILGGEWWRTVTSLTLHANFEHLASNLVFGVLFLAFASHLLGTGVTLLACLLSGMLGTVLNAVIQDPTHLSIGASTSVFGSIGTLVAFVWADRRRRRVGALYIWSPILIGVLFLGWLGMEGINTDVMAHATGFASGLLIGAALGRIGSSKLAFPELQLTCGIFSGLLVVAAWIAALTAG